MDYLRLFQKPGINLIKGSGDQWRGNCPFHSEKTKMNKSFSCVVYETLGQAWPVCKGRLRWIKMIAKILKIQPYTDLREKRIGEYKLRLDPSDPNDQLYYFCINYSYI